MNKTILITGAAKRIGASLARKFANLNYNILIHYNNSEIEAKKLLEKINSENITVGQNVTVKAFKANLLNSNEIVNLFEFGQKEFGKIDILINNAGIFPQKQSINEINLTQWNNIMNINLTAQLLTVQEFTKQNITEGKIINFSSLGGLKIWEKRIPYNISKSAVIQLTKALARELAPRISVNCICPGVVKIDENEEIFITVDKIPMRKYATVEDIFAAANFFVTSTNYITGQILTVDGGMSLI